MEILAQIQLLIDNAPQDGVTPQTITRIAPVLNAIASSLRHPQYYILQNLEQNWILTTLSNRANADLSKRVIYAYPTLQDVPLTSSDGLDPQLIATPILVIHILFQLVALEPVDSIVFFETPGTTNNAVEVQRSDLQRKIKQKFKNQRQQNQIPPNIA